MSKRARRILFTLAVLAFASLIAWSVIYGKSRQNRLGTAAHTPGQSSPAVPAASQPAATPDAAAQPAATAPSSAPSTGPSLSAPATEPMRGLRAVAPRADESGATSQPAASALGSLDPRKDLVRVQLSRFGAGIERIEFANIWKTAEAQRESDHYLRGLPASDPIDISQLPENERYVLATRAPSKSFDAAAGRWIYSGVPVMALRSLAINGAEVDMLNDDAWSESSPGVFESRIVNEAGEPIALVMRRYSLAPGGFDVALQQRVTNLTAEPLTVRWQQYGPVDLPEDISGYIPRRRLHFGFLPDPTRRPTLVLADDKHVIERGSAIKVYVKALGLLDQARLEPDPARAGQLRSEAAELLTLWPTADTRAGGLGMSWFASTNRYFGMAVHPPMVGDRPATFSIENALSDVEIGVSNPNGGANETLFTTLRSPTVSVAPGVEHAFDVAIYSGPLDRHILGEGAFGELSMSGMIIYSMSGCCTFLTFQWLAHLLLWFLSVLHDFVFFDWGLAIIGLVIVVRALLHPLTKRSQINMMRFGKQMQALKPEIDKLQKKYGNDRQKMQQEQMRLMREHHINPLQMLGCLPLFLQMPIWIALWATLYLAFDIRHQPAFYGVFQLFGGWPFLGDLSSPDSFIPLGAGFNIPLVGWHINAVNLLPILMGVVFFIQQKYMTPPTTANMSPEQVQQQKIMKWMTVVLFPLMMYKSPSGLTLYIMTSSIIGILESRYVRRHIDQMDLAPKPDKPAAKPKGALARAWAERLESMKEKQRLAQQDRKSFKKRK